MAMTRGEFLRSLAVGAGAALSSMTPVRAGDGSPSTEVDVSRLSDAERVQRMVERLSKETFLKNLNSTFRVLDKTSPTVVEARLVEVNEGRSNEQVEQFSLIFRGPPEPCLAQQTYELQHSAMGTFDLFLVPVGADADGMTYEAVFSRLVQ